MKFKTKYICDKKLTEISFVEPHFSKLVLLLSVNKKIRSYYEDK